MTLPIYRPSHSGSDHEEAVKWALKSRLSYLHANVDRVPVRQTAKSLGRILADLKSYLDGLTP